MRREMLPIEVYVADSGLVCLKQASFSEEEADPIVCLHPAQIETVIEWMKQSKAEAESIQEAQPMARDQVG